MTAAPANPSQLPPADATGAPPNPIVAVLGAITRLFDTRGGLLVFGFATLYCTWTFILKPMQADNKVDLGQAQKLVDSNAATAQDLASAMRDLRETARDLRQVAELQSAGKH